MKPLHDRVHLLSRQCKGLIDLKLLPIKEQGSEDLFKNKVWIEVSER
jgi:hypothetical protein